MKQKQQTPKPNQKKKKMCICIFIFQLSKNWFNLKHAISFVNFYVIVLSNHPLLTKKPQGTQYTEVRFANFFSGGFIAAIVVNPAERRLAKRTSVHWPKKILMPYVL